MTRLGQNRALTQFALKTGSKATDILELSVWGNQEYTVYPEIRITEIGNKVASRIVDSKWANEKLSPRIHKRGTDVII